ncbi:IS200/IS605 family element transposase accessory protein TnpB [Candidatus Micrarchaeota archaeon]|nr:IS200/IS605 family element transposase accessory protein TnpB [Candidatus Micrarchaeota archaeon]
MGMNRAWRYRLYPSKAQQEKLNGYLRECKNLWNSLLEYTKAYYNETGKFPTRKEFYLLTKEPPLFSQVAQNVADRLSKSLKGMMLKKNAGKKAGFPRFKPIERIKSFTYPQFGFILAERLELSGIGSIPIKKHRALRGNIKTLTIKKMPSGKWFAIFTSEVEAPEVRRKIGTSVGLDLGIETFAYLSDGSKIENPRYLRLAEERLKLTQRCMSKKKKRSLNRVKARRAVAVAHEKLTNRRRDFLHKVSRALVTQYALIAVEALNIEGLARGFLAKEVLDCSWAEFSSMLAYKAEEAGCEVVLVNPANTTSTCSSCGLVQKKSLAERWHFCPCGAEMSRDFNAAINILNRAIANSPGRVRQSELANNSATAGTAGSQACGEETPTHYKHNEQVSSMKQEAHAFRRG